MPQTHLTDAGLLSFQIFAGDGVINIPAQSNDPSCEGELCNIKGVSLVYTNSLSSHLLLASPNTLEPNFIPLDPTQICNVMVTDRTNNPSKSSMEVLADLSKAQRGDGRCVDVNWQLYLQWYGAPTKQNANDRSWLVRG